MLSKEDEDDLYDDSLLSKRTLPPALNRSSMSCASRQSTKLSLGFRRMPFPVPSKVLKKDESGRQDVRIPGSLERNCIGVESKKRGVGSAFLAKDLNQNTINLQSPRRTQKCRQPDSQENREAIGYDSFQRSHQSKGRPSQEIVLNINQTFTRFQKPSDVLKRDRLNARTTRQTKIVSNISENPFTLSSLNLPSNKGIPWSIEKMMTQENNNFVLSKEIVTYDLVHHKLPKKRKRARKETCDWSYVDGASSSEADDDLLDTCPIFKRIPGTSFAVDALSHEADPRVHAHFLTRFREENGSQRSAVPIYCTTITAALMRGRHKIADNRLRTLEYYQPTVITGVKVTAIDAHNEPGSAVLLFQLPGNVNILYVGELGVHFTLESQPLFWSPSFKTDYLMVDTRQCKPGAFRLLREDLENRVETIVEDSIKKYPKSLVVVVSNGLMEKYLFTALALRLDFKVFAHGNSAASLAAVDDPVLNELLATRRNDATLHVVPQTSCTFDDLTKRLKISFSHAVVVIPRKDFQLRNLNDIKPVRDCHITAIDVPVIDGTSFSDLQRLVRFLRPKRLVSTVSSCSDPVQTRYLRQWLEQKDPVVKSVTYRRK